MRPVGRPAKHTPNRHADKHARNSRQTLSSAGHLSYRLCVEAEAHHLRGTELVPVESLHCGDPITDVHGGGEHYKVLESKPIDKDCWVLELESHAHDVFRVIERSFPTGYLVGRSLPRTL